ncbi:unnamed protein product [Leptosia nina]|uniref:Uncharacterized protein n=1 Tax=Leptosia nina TaxID=320188 RepID=A0AAV1IX71_9NEOP
MRRRRRVAGDVSGSSLGEASRRHCARGALGPGPSLPRPLAAPGPLAPQRSPPRAVRKMRATFSPVCDR